LSPFAVTCQRYSTLKEAELRFPISGMLAAMRARSLPLKLSRFVFFGLLALLPLLVLGGCPSRESVGTRTVTILGAGVVNNPANKSLRFDILKFGLESFCTEMLRGGAPLKMSDDEPVIGRFFAQSCQSQVLDDESRKSFIVQYTGRGYAWTNLTGKIGFASGGLVEYAPDFQLHEGALYVYFRPRMLDATQFQALVVESAVAKTGMAVAGVNADAVGRKVVEGQLRRGFTVVRYSSDGETDFGMGLIPVGEKPFKPFSIERTDKKVLINERTEVHSGQQDYIGALEVKDDDQALYFTMSIDGASAVDVFLVPKLTGESLLDTYIRNVGASPLSVAPLLDEAVPQGNVWKRFVNVPAGFYYVVVDNSAAAGRTAPPTTAFDDRAAKVDYVVLAGERQ
jgi:hypothetical protein